MESTRGNPHARAAIFSLSPGPMGCISQTFGVPVRRPFLGTGREMAVCNTASQ